MATKKTSVRVVYNVHVKVNGKWFDKEFLAKDDKRNELKHKKPCESLTLSEARFIAGDEGIVWRIITVNELVIQEICNPVNEN